jgi:bifunctional N-acetylglucosamine-1-phosphate-uridyltransferase/glucosamine-1-phosphate-acetyltransferase GlmU-like protein
MAGEGSRFKEKGYAIPKPVLPIMGYPMVVSATKALPGPDENLIFIMRDFQIRDYKIDKTVKTHFPEARIISVDRLTEGQASTCLLAKEFINNEHELFIGASDNGMLIDNKKFEELSSSADALVFTFRNNPTVLPKPKAYGWLITGEDGLTITEARVKQDMKDPMKHHANVGAFWFKKGSLFVEAAERMIAQNRRVNGEFYVDECINDVVQLGYTAKVFEVDHYICWGTPDDYKTFLYWEQYYKLRNKVLEKK